VVALGLGAALALPSAGYAVLEGRIGRLEQALSRRTGVACHIAAVQAGLTGNLRVRGVEVGALFAADAVEVSMSWASLLSGSMHLDEVRVEAPRMQLTVRADGESELSRMVARIASTRRPPVGAGGGAEHRGGTAAPRRIVVSQGELALTIADLGSVRAQGVELVPHPDGVRAISGAIRLRAASAPCRGDAGCAPPVALELELARAAADLGWPRLNVLRLIGVSGRGSLQVGETQARLSAVSLARLSPQAALSARMTVDDHGVPRPFEVWALPHPQPTLMVRGDRLPLWPIAALAPSWAEAGAARFSGQLTMARGAALGLTVDGQLDDVVVQLATLAPTPVTLSPRLQLAATLVPPHGEDGEFEISASGRWALGEARWSGTFAARRGAAPSAGLAATLDAELERAPCAALLASVPVAMRQKLEGMALAGELGGRLRVSVDTNAPLGEGAEVSTGLDGNECSVQAEPPMADVTSLRGPREQQFPDGSQATIGPGERAWIELKQLPPYVDGAFVASLIIAASTSRRSPRASRSTCARAAWRAAAPPSASS
jgi:hypothetical protein